MAPVRWPHSFKGPLTACKAVRGPGQLAKPKASLSEQSACMCSGFAGVLDRTGSGTALSSAASAVLSLRGIICAPPFHVSIGRNVSVISEAGHLQCSEPLQDWTPKVLCLLSQGRGSRAGHSSPRG